MSAISAKPSRDIEGAGRPTDSRRSRGIRHRAKRTLSKGAAYTALLMLSAFVLLPVGWMFTAALKRDRGLR